MNKQFEGYYYKHQKDNITIAFIVGSSTKHSFIQVLTNDASYYFMYPLSLYYYDKKKKIIKIGDNIFSKQGIKLNINQQGMSILGEIKYINVTPLKYNIMGPFSYLPMQCHHSIVSLHHKLSGSININRTILDLSGGIGYIEGDRGTSFPKTYTWVHCNDFYDKSSIVASVAEIPFLFSHFTGCICVIYYKGKEYRLATYLGVRVLQCNDKKIILKQGKYRLEIRVFKNTSHALLAPKEGQMTRKIYEIIACKARFCFYKDNKIIFKKIGNHTSFEYVK